MKKGEVVTGPQIIARGFIYSHEAEKLVDEAKSVLLTSLGKMDLKSADWNEIKAHIKQTLQNLFFRRIGRKPIIIPVVMDIK